MAAGPRMQVTADVIAEPTEVDPRPRHRPAQLPGTDAAAPPGGPARQSPGAKAARLKAVRGPAPQPAASASRAKERARLLTMTRADRARRCMGDFGFGAGQWGCLDPLWQKRERLELQGQQRRLRRLRHPAGAAGLQDVLGGCDWRTNPVTQIKWGLQYIKHVYGSPCNAWSQCSRATALVLTGPASTWLRTRAASAAVTSRAVVQLLLAELASLDVAAVEDDLTDGGAGPRPPP